MVEVVFGIPGLGLILVTTLFPVFVGLLGNLVQDVLYRMLDPRIE